MIRDFASRLQSRRRLTLVCQPRGYNPPLSGGGGVAVVVAADVRCL